jgi:Osmosensitive K+ channel His kinase sensor domain
VATVRLANLRDAGAAAGGAAAGGVPGEAAGGAPGAAPGALDVAAVLAVADEIEMVDTAPSVLADRVRRGEIVPDAQIEQALKTDYAPQSLAALRERAFSIVVEHTDRGLADYQRPGTGANGEVRPPSWPASRRGPAWSR